MSLWLEIPLWIYLVSAVVAFFYLSYNVIRDLLDRRWYDSTIYMAVVLTIILPGLNTVLLGSLIMSVYVYLHQKVTGKNLLLN